MTDQSRPGAREDRELGADPARPRRGLPLVAVLILDALLVAVLVAGVVVAVVYANKGRDADRLAEDRSDATASAEQFALRMDNFDGADMKSYAGNVDKLLTTKAKAQFAQQFQAFSQVYAQGKAKGQGKVLLSAVGDADHDKATVLVVHDGQVKSNFGNSVRHYRWTVKLDKVGSRWLVDEFNPAG